MGLVQQIALPRLLGLDGYGALASVLSIAGITYNPVTTTSIQSVSRALAQATPETEAGTIRRVFTVHAVFALLLAGDFSGSRRPSPSRWARATSSGRCAF